MDNQHKLILNPPGDDLFSALEVMRASPTLPPILENISTIERRISFIFGKEEDITNSLSYLDDFSKSPKPFLDKLLKNIK